MSLLPGKCRSPVRPGSTLEVGGVGTGGTFDPPVAVDATLGGVVDGVVDGVVVDGVSGVVRP
jgi:hypothetical protein